MPGGAVAARLPSRPKKMTKTAIVAPSLVYTMGEEATRAAIDAIGEFLVDGMRHRIAAILPIDAAIDAHERQEAGAVSGKILLQP